MAKEKPDKVHTLFTKLESRQSILSSCTSLFKTLTSQFSSLEQSIASESQTLDTKLRTLDSDYLKSFETLDLRKQSMPARLSPISSQIETLTQLALSEFEKPKPENPPTIADELKSLCIKMDVHELLHMITSKRKEGSAVKSSIESALSECVDPVRLVLDSVADFLELNINVKSCLVLVEGLFPFEKLKERKEGVGVLFPKSVLERANKMAKEWKEKAVEKVAAGLAKQCGNGMYGMGPSEVSLFLHFVIGFGLMDTFEYQFLKTMLLDFALRKDWKDLSKYSLPLFGEEKVEDIVNELLEGEKNIDAVYFIKAGNLSEKFDCISILRSHLSKAEKDAKDALRKGNNSSEADDEASLIERTALKHIIKCVQEHKLEDDFPLTIPSNRMSNLERIKNEKKKAASSGGGRHISHKRGHSSNGPPPSHPAKVPRSSGSYRQPYGQRNPVSPAHQNPVSRYSAPCDNYPKQSAYDTAPYGGTYLPGSSQAVSQQPPQYDYAPPPAPRVGGSYGGSYSLYDTYAPSYTR